MRSYEVCECGAPLQLREQPTPVPVGTEVLLQVTAAGICHSDIHFWEGVYDIGGGKVMRLTDRGLKLPLTLGHENVGRVVAVGPEVSGVTIGDERLVYPWIGCGACAVCRRGDEQLCLKPQFVGAFRPGGFSDHLLVPHPRCLVDYGDLAPEQAAPLACSGLTAYGALKKFGDLLKTEPVVVIGAGGVGLMALAILRAMGARGAIVVDIDPKKREAAMQAGALAVVDGRAADAAAQIPGDRQRPDLGGGRFRRLRLLRYTGYRSAHQGRSPGRGRSVRWRDHIADAVYSDAGDDIAGLLHR